MKDASLYYQVHTVVLHWVTERRVFKLNYLMVYIFTKCNKLLWKLLEHQIMSRTIRLQGSMQNSLRDVYIAGMVPAEGQFYRYKSFSVPGKSQQLYHVSTVTKYEYISFLFLLKRRAGAGSVQLRRRSEFWHVSGDFLTRRKYINTRNTLGREVNFDRGSKWTIFYVTYVTNHQILKLLITH